ncbi:MAG: TonB-dependent receptor [Bacteroidales bacterium]|nr:TonB-dependent receptor [Bacteroidales bacterium]
MNYRLLFAFCFFCVCFQENFSQNQNDSIKVIKLEEVVITATKFIHILKDVPIETNLITLKEIEQSGVITVSDAIRWVPGLNISGGAPFGSSRRFTGIIRGLPAHYSLVLIDGKRIKGEHIHTGVNLGLVPIEMVEKIEIVKGPSCALYGSDAMGGIINIITKTISEKQTIKFGASYGSFNTQDYDLSYGNKFGKFGCFIAGKYTNSKGFPLILDDKKYDNQWFKQFNTLVKISYDVNDRNTINLNAKYYNINYLRKTAADINDNEIDLILDWKTKFNEKSSLSVSTAYSEFTGSRKDANNITSSGDVMYYYKLSKNHELTTGAEGRHEYFTRVGVQPGHEENIFSIYAQDEMKLGKKIRVAATVRVDMHTNLAPVVSPNGSVLFKLSDKTSIRGAVGRGFRAPSLQDRYEYHFYHKTYYRDGNSGLKPEFSISYSVGLEQQITKNLLGRISVFRNDFSNMIVVLPTGEYETDSIPIYRRQNIKTALTQGIETEFRYKWNNLNIVVGYTYLDTKDDEELVLSYNPKHLTTARIYYDFKNINLIVMSSVEDARGRYYNESGNINQLEDYTLLNLHVTKQIRKHFHVFGTIGNIFNKQFETYEEGKTFAAYGRTLTGGLKIKII